MIVLRDCSGSAIQENNAVIQKQCSTQKSYLWLLDYWRNHNLKEYVTLEKTLFDALADTRLVFRNNDLTAVKDWQAAVPFNGLGASGAFNNVVSATARSLFSAWGKGRIPSAVSSTVRGGVQAIVVSDCDQPYGSYYIISIREMDVIFGLIDVRAKPSASKEVLTMSFIEGIVLTSPVDIASVPLACKVLHGSKSAPPRALRPQTFESKQPSHCPSDPPF